MQDTATNCYYYDFGLEIGVDVLNNKHTEELISKL